MNDQEGRELVVVDGQGLVPVEQELSLVEGVPEVVEGEWEEVPEAPVVVREAPAQKPGFNVTARGAAAAAAAAERAGGAARRLLAGVGAKLGEPAKDDNDLSDLFEGPDMSKDNDVYIDDLVTVSEEDVFGDGGEDMSDLLEVGEDVLEVGEEELSPGEECAGKQPARQNQKRYIAVRRAPPGGLSGVQY